MQYALKKNDLLFVYVHTYNCILFWEEKYIYKRWVQTVGMLKTSAGKDFLSGQPAPPIGSRPSRSSLPWNRTKIHLQVN